MRPEVVMDSPAGRPVAVKLGDCPGGGTACSNCRSTGSPLACFRVPGFSSARLAGLAWSRSVVPEIPFTVPLLEYCHRDQAVQPAGSSGLPELLMSGTHTGVWPNAVLLPVQVDHQDGGV